MVEPTRGFHQLSALIWAWMCHPILGNTLPLPELLPVQNADGMETNEVSTQNYVIGISCVHNKSNILHHNYMLENAAPDNMSSMQKWTRIVKGIEL